MLAAHRPEIQHEQNDHDDIVCDEAVAEQAADDVDDDGRNLMVIAIYQNVSSCLIASLKEQRQETNQGTAK